MDRSRSDRQQVALGMRPGDGIDVAAKLPCHPAAPIDGQELHGQLRVMQQGAAKVVHQQGLDQKALFGIEIAGRAKRAQHRPEAFDEVDTRRAPSKFQHSWTSSCSGLLVSALMLGRAHGDHLVMGAGFLKDVQQGFGIRRGMGQNARGQRAVAGPGGISLRS